MIQRLAVKYCGSAEGRAIVSGSGGCFAASPTIGTGVAEMRSMPGVWARIGNRGKLLAALVSAPVFVLSLVAAEWPFAGFLMTKAAENRFFATGHYPYMVPPWSPSVLRQFVHSAHGLALVRGLGFATICAAITLWLGLSVGAWMRKIQR